jgi:hypothetical protein
MAVLVIIAVPASAAKLKEATIYIEGNATDGDAGIQVFFDAEGWKTMKIFDPDGRKIFDVRGKGGIAEQGLTELFIESVEPPLDDFPLDDLMARFPEGKYTFSGKRKDNASLRGKASLTYAIPEGPLQVFPAEGDEVDPEDLVLEWELVADPPGSEITGYNIIVVREDGVDQELNVVVGPDVTSLDVPGQFLAPGTEYKWEISAVETSGNKTISETEFETE